MNEEDIRAKVLVPWLDALGVGPGEYEPEYGFQVRVGREKVKLPRSDVVVRKRGRPLFIVEAKEPGHAITDADREQALSYARLLQPDMAPFAVVTNGRESEVRETITGRTPDWTLEHAKDDPSLWEAPTPDVSVSDINLRFQALRRLISLSPETASSFCGAQIAHATERTGIDGPRPAFDPDLHVARPALSDAFERFLSTDAVMLIVEAPSGLGKTSECIRLARTRTASDFPIYIPLDQADADPLGYLATEFSWSLSAQRREQELLRDLDELCRDSGRRLILFLDEPEPCDLAKLRAGLERIHRWAKDLGGRIRIVLAGQPVTVQDLRGGRGYPTVFGQQAEVYRLGALQGQEVDELVWLLRAKFKFAGEVGGILRTRCADPTFAQIMAREFSGRALPGDIPPADVFRRYLRSLVERSGDAGAVDDVLETCASYLRSADAYSASISGLREARSDVTDSALQRAARVHLISIEVDEHGRKSVRFPDPWTRNYSVAFLDLRLDQLPPSARSAALARHSDSTIAREALTWFLWAHPDERRDFLIDVERAAESYVRAYDAVLAQFPLWHQPLAPVRIGLVPTIDWANPAWVVQPVGRGPGRVEWLVGSYTERFADSLDRATDRSIDGNLRWGTLWSASRTEILESGQEDAWEYVCSRLNEGPIRPSVSADLAIDTIWALADTYPDWIPSAAAGNEDEQLLLEDLLKSAAVMKTYLALYTEIWVNGGDIDRDELREKAKAMVAKGTGLETSFRILWDALALDAFLDALSAVADRSSVGRVVRPGFVRELDRPNRLAGDPGLRDEFANVLSRGLEATRAGLAVLCQPIMHLLPRFKYSALRLRVEIGRWTQYGGQGLGVCWLKRSEHEDVVEVIDPKGGDVSFDRLRFDYAGREKLRQAGVVFQNGGTVRSLLGLSYEAPPSFGLGLRSGHAEKLSVLWCTATSWIREEVKRAEMAALAAARDALASGEKRVG